MSLPPDRETTYLDGHVTSTEGALITIRLKGTGSDKLAHLSPPSLLSIPKHAVIGGADVEADDTGIEVKHSWIKGQSWFGYVPGAEGEQGAPSEKWAEAKRRAIECAVNPPYIDRQQPSASTLGAAFDTACHELIQAALNISGNDQLLAKALLNAAAEKARQ